jgi:DNA-binding beta-propeller fold protein YncE
VSGRLTSGSNPSVLPGPILIADEHNHRLMIIDPRGRIMWQFPRPGDLDPGQTFTTPDDAFFTPDGRQIIVAQEDDSVIRVIDVAMHKIVDTYGKPGVPASGPDRLNHPDGSLMLANGDILTRDINNCRIVLMPKGGHAVSRQLGVTGTCVHSPPKTFGKPSGMFPMSNGSYLVTEAEGNWVDEMDLSGHVAWSARLPNVSYIYESNEISPNGDVLVVDKANHRIIVVDPRTNYVVWQYGHTHVAGSGSGYLNNPTGLDVYPPNSVLTK